MDRMGILAVCIAASCLAHADPIFSLDSASPSLIPVLQPSDILTAGPTLQTSGASLGLGPLDELNGVSYGLDVLTGPLTLYFSVDRLGVGLPGTAVYRQALPGVESAAGDVFQSIGNGTNYSYLPESSLGLVGGFFGDDLDALELGSSYPSTGTYFSIDSFSAVNSFGILGLEDNILFSQGGGFTTFADGVATMGLLSGDNIDGFALWDVINPGVLDPGIDMALFSLTSFSSSTFTSTGSAYDSSTIGHYSPADLLFTTFSGSSQVLYTAASLGLLSDDNLDALDTSSYVAVVPEPTTMSLLGLGTILLAIRRRAAAPACSRRVDLP